MTSQQTLTVTQSPRASPVGVPGGVDPVVAAALEAIAYADVFDWPLTAAEVHRFLPVRAQRFEVSVALGRAALDGLVVRVGSLYVLPGRASLVARRCDREATSARLWPAAVRWCRMLARLPWVRLVAVSGSLAVGAAGDGADVDLFIVTVDGRVWLGRALAIAVGRASRRGELWLCPNYILGEGSLALPERDLFTAHELVQLVPLFGPDAYRALLAANGWYREFLPNHPGYSGRVGALPGRAVRRAVEPLLRNPAVARLEDWEMRRKVARLGGAPARDPAEVRFDATTSKGHFGGYRRRTLERLRRA
ncbi:MAG TPA: hypothetical protein VGQ42_03090 [Candidatus Dormibacteraeota bacterium]|jgi:hypothetical protein|nr:hypothetical protein [Candidatus Dormibacteraeota bacterium]